MDNIPPKVQKIVASSTTPEGRFIVRLLLKMATDDQVNAVIAEMSGGGTDYTQPMTLAGGRPLRHFLNKSRKVLMRELDNNVEAVEEIVTAMADRGRTVEDDMPAQPSAEQVAIATERDLTARREAAGINTGKPKEPAKIVGTFGTENWPAADLWESSDADILAVDGITAADLTEIRRQQAEAAAAVSDARSEGDSEPVAGAESSATAAASPAATAPVAPAPAAPVAPAR